MVQWFEGAALQGRVREFGTNLDQTNLWSNIRPETRPGARDQRSPVIQDVKLNIPGSVNQSVS